MKTALRTLVAMLCACGLNAGLPAPFAQAAQQNVGLLKQACVFILSEAGAGSGFFVAPGYVATNAHVVAGAGNPIFVANRALGGLTQGHVVALSGSSAHDYAVLRVEVPPGVHITPLTFASGLEITEKVGAWGFPGLYAGLDPAYERLFVYRDMTAAPEIVYKEGTVSAILPRRPPWIMHSADTSHGNSGGPLVNEAGEVVGINTMITPDQRSNRQDSIALSGQDLLRFLRAYGIPAQQGQTDSAFAARQASREPDSSSQDDIFRAAEQGDAGAQVNLGFMYEKGRGVPQDDHQAVAWYRKAAEQGNAGAQFNLGFMYWEGRGVPQDDRQAVAWYRKAAEQGNAGAQVNLGFMYEKGRGVPQDDHQAVAWYRKAAEQNYADAQRAMGLMYLEGNGVPQDDRQAAVWFRKAAEQGLATAQFDLGAMYLEGSGVPQDDQQAAMWFHKAAVQGEVNAQHNLGGLYLEGRGVPQDYRQAAAWYRRAAEQGKTKSQQMLRRMGAEGLLR